MTGFDGDPGKKLLVPKGKVDLAPNSDGETAQAFGQAADNSFGMAANKITYTAGRTGGAAARTGRFSRQIQTATFQTNPQLRYEWQLRMIIG